MRSYTVRFISLLLAAVLALGVLPFAAFAETGETVTGKCGEDVTYTLDEKGWLTLSGTGATYNAEYEGWLVDDSWGRMHFNFSSTSPLKALAAKTEYIQIEEGITAIGSALFAGFENVRGIIFPESLKSIGASAFEECRSIWQVLELPEGLEEIGERAFAGIAECLNVVLPASLKTIENDAFSRISKSEQGNLGIHKQYVSVPLAIWFTGTETQWETLVAGKDIDGATNSIVATNHERYIRGELNIPTVTLAEGEYGCKWKLDNHGLFTYYGSGEMKGRVFDPDDYAECPYELPQPTYLYQNIIWEARVSPVEIGDAAFAFCKKMRSVDDYHISAKRIGKQAFYGCTGLHYLTLSGNVESIDDEAFFGCSNLSFMQIHTPSVTGLTTLGEAAFAGTGLTLIRDFKSTSVTKISDRCFECSKLQGLALPHWLETIGDDAFYRCEDLKEMEIPNGTKTIGNEAFRGCSSLEKIYIPASVTSIGEAAFADIRLTEKYTVPIGLKDIYFGGTKTQWEKAKSANVYGSGKTEPKGVTVHFKADPDAVHAWKSNGTINPASFAGDGFIPVKCTYCEKESQIKIPKATAALSKTAFVYNGKVQTPQLTVKDSTGKALPTKNYTATWSNADSRAVGKYTVTVKLKGANYSGKKTVTYTIAPKKVTGLKKAASTVNSVKLSWTKATGAKYYQIYAYSAKEWKLVKTVTTNSATVTKVGGKALTPGTTYYFRVRALDESKKAAGAFSATLKTGTRTAAPAITKLVSTKTKTATVTWSKVKGAKSYSVYKSFDAKTWTLVKSGLTGNTFTLTGLPAGKRVRVKIAAMNAYGARSAKSPGKGANVK